MSPRKRSAVVCHRALSYSIFISVVHKDPELIYTKFIDRLWKRGKDGYNKAEKSEYCNRCQNKELKVDK